MARRTRTSSARPIVVRAPAARPIIVRARSAGRRIAHHARRAGGAAVGAAASEKHTLIALASAFAYGTVRKSGVKIPTIGPFGPASTVGLGLWALGRWGGNKTAAHAATGLLSIAAYQFASTGEVVGTGVVYPDGDEG